MEGIFDDTATSSAVEQNELVSHAEESNMSIRGDGATEQQKIRINERPTRSVVIDEDEEDEDECQRDQVVHSHEETAASSTPSIPDPVEQTFKEHTAIALALVPFQDHTYVSVAQHAASSPSKCNLNFPVMHGLDIDESEDYGLTSTQSRAQQQIQRHSSVRRLPGYGYEDTGVGYYKQQMMRGGAPKYSGYQTRFSHAIFSHQKRQEIPEREEPMLLPYYHGRSPAAASLVDTGIGAAYSGGGVPSPRTTHSLPPPQRGGRTTYGYSIAGADHLPHQPSHAASLHFSSRVDSGDLSSSAPAPIITARSSTVSTRGRTLERARSRQNSIHHHMDTPFPQSDHHDLQLHLRRKERGFERNEDDGFISPHPSEPLTPTITKRMSPKNQSVSAQRKQNQQHNTFVCTMEEEEMENEKFFSQRRQNLPTSYGHLQRSRSGGRHLKKTYTDEIPIELDQSSRPEQQQQDLSKPPDDPVPRQHFFQQQQHCLVEQQQHDLTLNSQQQGYESSIDSAIDSVVRGDALVMQNYMTQQHLPLVASTGPSQHQPMSPHIFRPPSVVSAPQPISPAKPPSFGLQTISTHSIVHQQQQQPPLLFSNQRLEDLAELAQASSHLVQQHPTSSSLSAQQQQQSAAIHHPIVQLPSLQTLHFKVVDTNSSIKPAEPCPTPECKQQVFTVKQQIQDDPEPKHQMETMDVHHDHDQQQTNTMTNEKKTNKKLTRNQLETIHLETGQILRNQNNAEEEHQITSKRRSQAENEVEGTETATETLKKRGRRKSGGDEPVHQSAEEPEPVVALKREMRRRTLLNMKKEEQKPQKAPMKGKKKRNSWKNVNYTTRCICGMTHNDPFMIQCDGCDVWQHAICMGILKKSVPERYFCEQCVPRELKLNATQAAARQKRNLTVNRYHQFSKGLKQKALLKRRSAPPIRKLEKTGGIRDGRVSKKRTVSTGTILGRSHVSLLVRNKEIAKKGSNNLDEIVEGATVPIESHYSRAVKTMMAHQPNSPQSDIVQVQSLKDQSKRLARQMYVAPNVEGLVATPAPYGSSHVPSGALLIEYTGMISCLSEIYNRSPNRLNQHTFTLIYRGLGEGNELFVDATKYSESAARSARRSCRPNSAFKHIFLDGKLHIFLYATVAIDHTIEITIPFDFDFWESKLPVECACGLKKNVPGGTKCPVLEFNEALNNPANFQQIKMLRKSELNKTTCLRKTHGRIKDSISHQRPMEVKLKSPKKEEDEADSKLKKERAPEEEGHRLRSRTSLCLPSTEQPPSPVIAAHTLLTSRITRSSASTLAALVEEGSMMKEDSPELGIKAASKRNSEQKDEDATMFSSSGKLAAKKQDVSKKLSWDIWEKDIDNDRQQSRVNKSSTGLATLVDAYRRSLPSSSSSLKSAIQGESHAKRGRPPGKINKGKETKLAINQEMVQDSPQKLSREERKMKAVIALVDSIGRNQIKKRKSSGPSTEPARDYTSTKKKVDVPLKESIPTANKMQIDQLCDEFVQALRSKIGGTCIDEDFALPSDFDELRQKLEKEQEKTMMGNDDKNDELTSLKKPLS